MCRFIAYMGRQPILLKALLDEPENSLIKQSRHARIGEHTLNADGFGLSWYDKSIDPLPGIYKSVQPAWNDTNLKHLASKIGSSCFLAHVRASTVGGVTLNNCHPFCYEQYSMVHNGTIHGFNKIRRTLLNRLSDDFFDSIRAQTDSEHLFFLIMQCLRDNPKYGLEYAVKQAFQLIQNWQQRYTPNEFAHINITITDGDQLLATRYTSRNDAPPSLYYAMGAGIIANEQVSDKHDLMVASEPLSDCADKWHEIPVNHYLTISKQQDHIIRSFD